tara:strand:- start:1543 stop:1689 length:147 start_codon:yes stop_codon:yes gene_type:complete
MVCLQQRSWRMKLLRRMKKTRTLSASLERDAHRVGHTSLNKRLKLSLN